MGLGVVSRGVCGPLIDSMSAAQTLPSLACAVRDAFFLLGVRAGPVPAGLCCPCLTHIIISWHDVKKCPGLCAKPGLLLERWFRGLTPHRLAILLHLHVPTPAPASSGILIFHHHPPSTPARRGLTLARPWRVPPSWPQGAHLAEACGQVCRACRPGGPTGRTQRHAAGQVGGQGGEAQGPRGAAAGQETGQGAEKGAAQACGRRRAAPPPHGRRRRRRWDSGPGRQARTHGPGALRSRGRTHAAAATAAATHQPGAGPLCHAAAGVRGSSGGHARGWALSGAGAAGPRRRHRRRRRSLHRGPHAATAAAASAR